MLLFILEKCMTFLLLSIAKYVYLRSYEEKKGMQPVFTKPTNISRFS